MHGEDLRLEGFAYEEDLRVERICARAWGGFAHEVDLCMERICAWKDLRLERFCVCGGVAFGEALRTWRTCFWRELAHGGDLCMERILCWRGFALGVDLRLGRICVWR